MRPDEIVARRARLDVGPAVVAELAALLSADERARAGRFVFPLDRQRYIVGRGTLRRILGTSLGASPAGIAFDYGPHGKPEIRGTSLRFNLSHSGDLMLVVLAQKRDVGCDLEAMRPDSDVLALATHSFEPEAVRALRSLEPVARRIAFYELWTRTEALLKARGLGLGGLALRPLADPGWTVVNVTVAPGFAAAVAAAAGAAFDPLVSDFD